LIDSAFVSLIQISVTHEQANAWHLPLEHPHF
jgi:hypothetical protein